MTSINGCWVVYDRTNVDELLEAYGTAAEKRDATRNNMMKQTLVFDSPDGITYNLTNIYPNKEHKTTFTAGQEFVYTYAGGATANATSKKVSDTKFDVLMKTASGDANAGIEVSGSELIVTTNFKNVTSVGKYKKQ